ncbi:ATP-dependent DNA ligase [Mycolicibacterium neoaurum]|uniref:Probable DNA ligase n=1 Tax=Mycolicibacterium neoaurum TaxID=1795 RepID=A0AAV2WEW7_MYCNE|nr:ATP-dependent DNA ligase [Mycolicibacterium neoaurum]CDQ42819.1 ATP-dependent DNA ligase I [Mycolicibacterium neoaurum]
MQLAEIAAASADIGATPSRLAKVERVAKVLGLADRDEIAVVVAWLSGELPQRQIGVGWAGLRDLPPPAADATLTVASVHAMLTEIKEIAGKGSKNRRAQRVLDLFAAATEAEQRFLRRLLSGELRQGAVAGVMADAVAKAMLAGDLSEVAVSALVDGDIGRFTLRVGRPVSPMLAQTATGVAEALDKLGGEAALETKLDGARVQIHRTGNSVAIYTRTLDDVTARLPEVVDAVLALPVTDLIADAEAIALRPDGRPHRFQVTASRFGSRSAAARAEPLSVFFFDLLHRDGVDLLDLPLTDRMVALDEVVPAAQRVQRLVTADPDAGREFLETTLAAGHEGVMAKAPFAPYEAGRRGAGWLKVKPVHTLDLVVLAVEWGSGRRTGMLSNIHLGARDPGTGEFLMLGKTFKGMTDEMLAWQTRRFTELAVDGTAGGIVRVRPEQVVEIAIDGVQASSRYPAGMALRFARVVRYRDDKPAAQADTVETVRELFERGG